MIHEAATPKKSSTSRNINHTYKTGTSNLKKNVK
jgi:hypothetical protein